ncbi:MAG: urea transporter [Prochlorotrichaceae cyanobacterium]
MNTEPVALHEIINRLLTPEPPAPSRLTRFLPVAGTWQSLNQRLRFKSPLDLLNAVLRGVGQVIFVNNPLSGLLILLALVLQDPWVGCMALLGTIAATATAYYCNLDQDTIRNGIFGYNGTLVGAALATFGSSGNGTWNGVWILAIVALAMLTTVMMAKLGVWWVKTFNAPPLTLPFNLLTLIFLAGVLWIPQPWFVLAPSAATEATQPSLSQLLGALPIGFGQVFLADRLLSGALVLLAVALCTPLGALIALVGSGLGVLAAWSLGIPLEAIYAGLWSYNALLAILAIGGIFYAPNLRSIAVGALTALAAVGVGLVLQLVFGGLKLPVLTLPFCIATVGCFMVLQRSFPSLVPVALHAVTSPEEHYKRYQVAKRIMSTFRRELGEAMGGQATFYLLQGASPALQDNLRFVFNAIDSDRNGMLSREEITDYVGQAGQFTDEAELDYLFQCMDRDSNGGIDFEEFGELMLRHRRLMANYQDFMTYFIPIDANGDDLISLEEMNVAMASVGEPALSQEEVEFLRHQTQSHSITWNRFIELLLIV